MRKTWGLPLTGGVGRTITAEPKTHPIHMADMKLCGIPPAGADRGAVLPAEHRPVGHQPPALLQRVTTPVGLLGGVADPRRERYIMGW